MKNILFIVLLFMSCLSFAQTRNLKVVKSPTENVTIEKRKAVVIGMSDYGAGRSLNNTLNDANDLVDVLSLLGFEVTLLTNNELPNLEANLAAWYNTIERNDMAIFYFAGHGVEVGGSNYLIPINVELNSEVDVRYKALSVNQVLDNMDLKQVRFKLLILDACRDNPFTRGWSRSSSEKGLAHINAPMGTLIAFAAAPGAVAHDGGTYNLQNGVFTHFLKQEFLAEGASIDNILNRVAGDVTRLTNNQQVPYKTGVITEDFYFKSRTNDRPSQVVVAEKPVEPMQPATPKTFYYYVDQNGNRSVNRFDDWEAAESEMRNKNLYGKIYSNAGEVFVVDKPVEAPKNVAATNENNTNQVTTTESNARLPESMKVISSTRQMEVEFVKSELSSNGKVFILEFLVTNLGQDQTWDCVYEEQEAIDNLGNKGFVHISSNSSGWGTAGGKQASNLLPRNTPVKIRVEISGISIQSTYFPRIRINGTWYITGWTSGRESGYFEFQNVRIR